jgi:glycerol kinase
LRSSIAHQIADVVDAFLASGAPGERLLVDGGPTRNDQLMQFEADMVGVSVERTSVAERSAMGVGYLAGLTAGIFTLPSLGQIDRGSQCFMPTGASGGDARQGEARVGTGRR